MMGDRKGNPESRPGHMGRPPFVPRRTIVPTPIQEEQEQREGDGTTLWLTLADEAFEPLPWDEVFEEKQDVKVEGLNGHFRCYFIESRKSSSALVLFHGGGQSALSWAAFCRELKPHITGSNMQVVAFDARGHGATTVQPDDELSVDRMVQDAVELLRILFPKTESGVERIVLAGHSMGGAISTRVSNRQDLGVALYGIVNIDVVEGTAMEALPHMQNFLRQRPKSFGSEIDAVKYMLNSNQLKRLESARLSVAPQLRYNDSLKVFEWRTNLEATEKYWKGWFSGLSEEFLSTRVMKLLVLAGVDRLDKSMTIAHMQGKFQNKLITTSGHAVHEDDPEKLAEVLIEFLKRNRLI